MRQKNKNHWYDGLFYDVVVAPNQDRAFARVRDLIAAGSTVLDVGCGTGRLAFQLAGHCRSVEGIDPSARNIDVARRRLAGMTAAGVRFHHADAAGFLADSGLRFDYATLSYVIHEVGERDRTEFLRTVSSAARNLIMVDYLIPQPDGGRKLLTAGVEMAAGRSHYRNYRSYVRGRGLAGLADRLGLIVLSELRNDPPSSHIMLARGLAG